MFSIFKFSHFPERDLTVDKTAIKRVAILDTCNLLFQCGRYSLDTKMTRQIGLNEYGKNWGI